MAHLFWPPEGDAMPNVTVHGPVCERVEGVPGRQAAPWCPALNRATRHEHSEMLV